MKAPVSIKRRVMRLSLVDVVNDHNVLGKWGISALNQAGVDGITLLYIVGRWLPDALPVGRIVRLRTDFLRRRLAWSGRCRHGMRRLTCATHNRDAHKERPEVVITTHGSSILLFQYFINNNLFVIDTVSNNTTKPLTSSEKQAIQIRHREIGPSGPPMIALPRALGAFNIAK